MFDVFDANLKGMSEQIDLFVSLVVQKIVIEARSVTFEYGLVSSDIGYVGCYAWIDILLFLYSTTLPPVHGLDRKA